ncbi:MAG: hypothetical protein RMM31_07470 [Anaerolineae bacterium]|nr:hypothetical protein [Anaerolineae bacterium]
MSSSAPVTYQVEFQELVEGRAVRVSVRIEGDPSAATPLILELSEAVSRALRAAAQAKPLMAEPNPIAARAALPNAAPAALEPPPRVEASSSQAVLAPSAQPQPDGQAQASGSPAAQTEPVPSSPPVTSTPSAYAQPEPALAQHQSTEPATLLSPPAPSVQTPPAVASAQAEPPVAALSPTRAIFGRLSAVFGVALLAAGIAAPLIAPVEVRRNVLPITVLCGTVGVLLLFSSVLSPAPSPPAAKPAPAPRQAAPRPALSYRKGRTPLQTALGLLVGGLFVLAGLSAPVLLGASTADERFLLMIGFAPVTVIGFFLIAIYGNFLNTRSAPAPARASASASPRAVPPRSARADTTPEYRAFVPVMVAALVVLMVAILLLVLVGNIVTALR